MDALSRRTDLATHSQIHEAYTPGKHRNSTVMDSRGILDFLLLVLLPGSTRVPGSLVPPGNSSQARSRTRSAAKSKAGPRTPVLFEPHRRTAAFDVGCQASESFPVKFGPTNSAARRRIGCQCQSAPP
eukprot:2501016-Rhodomonas_salina.1